MNKSPLRQVKLGHRQAVLTWRDEQVADLVVDAQLGAYPDSLIDCLRHWARVKPDAVFIARRDRTDDARWIEVTYSQTWTRVRHIASALLERDLHNDRQVAILSGNSIEHALLGLAAMCVGVPHAPVSPQYSLISKDFSKLKHVIQTLTPGLVFVDDGILYEKAIAHCVPDDCEVVVVDRVPASRDCTLFEALEKTPLSPRLDEVIAGVGPDTIAKFLFSSGSTDMPKAIINTQRMLCANQQMIVQTLPLLADPPPVIVDWLPWNHTFGGNHNVGIVLYNGGTFYIDDGKPTPDGFQLSVRNLKEVAPTVYFNVPKGYDELVKALKDDEQLRHMFFSRVQMLFYAGAGISQPVWDALEELAVQTCGERILIVTGLGCTETAPSSLFTTGDGGFAGWIGLPVAGAKTKLVRLNGKFELRVKGDHVTPGYWRNHRLTEKAFDSEGYYCTGDAVKIVDENDIQRGLAFDGRVTEDFKLDSGTWVSAGPLRARFLDFFGHCVKDVVIVGRDKPYVGALVFPDFEACRGLDVELAGLTDRDICHHDIVKQHFRTLLEGFAEFATGGASRIWAIKLLAEPPSLDRNEITDKGSLNAAAIQDIRRREVESLYTRDDADSLVTLD